MSLTVNTALGHCPELEFPPVSPPATTLPPASPAGDGEHWRAHSGAGEGALVPSHKAEYLT